MIQYTLSGWPEVVTTELKPYERRQHELTIECGCLLWGSRVIVPSKLQSYVLGELHVSHPGIVRMKSLSRRHIWWPNLDKDLEEMVSKCTPCQANHNKPPPAPLHPWSWPTGIWQRIHIDFAGPFLGHMFFLVIDAYSKWLEIFVMPTTTSSKTIEVLRSLFARYGFPNQIVSDNGPQFIAEEFESFCKFSGIHCITGAPYHPSTNGAVERAVQTMKKSLKSTLNEPGSLQMKWSQFFMSYRTIPHATTGETLAELFLKRSLIRLTKAKFEREGETEARNSD